MKLFGSWSEYQDAPEEIVTRQILLWQADLEAQVERERMERRQNTGR